MPLTTKPLPHLGQRFQYTSKSHAKQLEKCFFGSNSRRGDCFDKACIKPFFSHLKTEKLNINEMTCQAMQEYIQFYNTERFHKKIHGLFLIEYQEKAAI